MEVYIFSFYVIVLIGVGLYSAKNSKKNEDYYIDNWNLKFLQVGLSAGATGNSGFIMTGAVGLGYAYGISWIFLPIAWFLGDLVYWRYFPEKMNSLSREKKIISPLKLAFTKPIHIYIISFILIVSLGAYASSQFVASSISLSGYFGTTYEFGIIITSVVILLYVVLGGFKASVKSDLIQAFMMIFTTVFLIVHILTIYKLDYSFIETLSQTNSGFFIPFYQSSFFTIVAFFAGWSSASIGFGLGQPQIIQRYFAAESTTEIKRAKWVYLSFLQFTWIGMIVFGILLRLSNSNIENPEAGIAIYCSQNLHPIISGLIIAGVFSAIASTIDSMLLSMSTSIKLDIIKDRIKKIPNYLITLLVLIVLTIISYKINPSNEDATVFTLSKIAISLLASSLGVAIFLNLVFKNISSLAVIIGVITAFVICNIWFFKGLSEYIVESFPAMIIGILTALFANKIIKSIKQ